MIRALEHPRYHFDRWIATGGMGEVWAATDTLLDREVAVKVLKREYADDPVLRARFAAEARHAGSLQHPHVASILDYGELHLREPGSEQAPLPFLVMELVDGQPLSGLLSGGHGLAPEVATDLIAQAAEGVGAAHGLGIVHRDVKPGNLLITGAGQVKVTDFGVARAADADPLTLTGHLVGTPHYLAPEQAQGESATPASDVYALGIVLYECLTGSKPFVGESPVVTALMQIRDPLPAFPEAVPQRLQEIVRVATAKDPSARFRTADILAAALRDESPATRTFLLPGTEEDQDRAAPVLRAAPAPAAGSSAFRDRSSRLPRAAVAAALALVLLLTAGWALVGGSGESSDASVPADGTEQAESVQDVLVRVRQAEYVGLPRPEAARKLRDLGLKVRAERKDNPGSERAGTVASVAPRGRVEVGSRVTLTVWGPAPTVEPTTPERAPSPAPEPAPERPADEPPVGGGTAGSGNSGSGAPRGEGGGGGAGTPDGSPGRSGEAPRGQGNDNSDKGSGNGGNGKGGGKPGGNGKPGKGRG